MKIASPPPFGFRLLSPLLATALIAFAFNADAAQIRVAGTIQGHAHEATLVEEYHSGAQYASLIELIDQFGGGFSVLSSRMRIDMAGSTVWVQYTDRRVNAFRVFSLARPILRVDDDVMIASDDIAAFLANAFGIDVTVEAAAETLAVPLETDVGSTRPLAETAPEIVDRDIRAAVEASPVDQSFDAPSTTRFIVVDPGHGGFDDGISGANTVERELTLKAAEALRAAAADIGLPQVVLTRSVDMAMNAEERIRIASEARDTVFVSLHLGSSFSQDVRGSAVLYPASTDARRGRSAKNENKDFAQAISARLQSDSGIPHRGMSSTPLQIASSLDNPAIMLEIACLTNAADEAALLDDVSLRRIMRAVALGIAEYMGASNEPPGIQPL